MLQRMKLVSSFLFALLISHPFFAVADDYPTKPIQIVVPFAAGGQGDVLARLIVKRIEELKLLPQPMVIVNVPGGGATIGIRKAKKAKPDGYTLLYIHQTLMTGELMGKLKFKYTDLQPIAETNNTCLLTATADGSGVESGEDWIMQAKANPKSLKEATLIGSAAHFTTAMMSKASNMDVGYVNAGGGAKRIASILGNHTKTAVLVSVPVIKNPKLHGLVYYGESRNPLLPETPTAKELGYDVISCLNNVWWAPSGVPEDVVVKLAEAFKTVASDQQLIEEIEKKGQSVEYFSGDELDQRLSDIYGRLAEVAPTLK